MSVKYIIAQRWHYFICQSIIVNVSMPTTLQIKCPCILFKGHYNESVANDKMSINLRLICIYYSIPCALRPMP
jgi:hypothetical protein